MANVKRAIEAALKEVKAVLIRKGKHEIWKLPTGYLVTVSKSPSDNKRVLDNVRCDIRKGMKYNGNKTLARRS